MSSGAPEFRDGDHLTYCRLCEAVCGLIVKVEGGRIERIEPDREHPYSRGHVCIKGTTFKDLVYDPDRVLHPLKRVGGPGEFARVSWDEALDDIARRLKAIISGPDGTNAMALYIGNPS